MKKTLIALAALAATGASFAQVTLYGVVGGGYQDQKVTTVTSGTGTDARTTGFTNNIGAIGGGRFGVKGSEDLGSGLSASFNLEATANTADGTVNGGTVSGTTATNQLFNRQSWVGLSGGFGEIRLGRTFTPLYEVLSAADVFETQGITTVNLDPATPTRASNALHYTTPKTLGGFVVKAMYGTLDTGKSSANGAVVTTNTGLSVGYAAGPLAVAFGMGVVDTNGTVTAGVSGKNDGQALSASYDFGAAKLFAGYTKGKTQANVGIDTTQTDSETNLGVSVPFGSVTVLAALGRNSRTVVTTGTETATSTGDGTDWALGAYYNLSKRTVVYAKTGVYDKYAFGASANGTSNSTETSATTIGLRHAF